MICLGIIVSTQMNLHTVATRAAKALKWTETLQYTKEHILDINLINVIVAVNFFRKYAILTDINVYTIILNRMSALIASSNLV